MTDGGVASPKITTALSAMSVRLVQRWAAEQAAELALVRGELASIEREIGELQARPAVPGDDASLSMFSVVDGALESAVARFDAEIDAAASDARAVMAAATRRARETLVAAGAGADALAVTVPSLPAPTLRRPTPAVEFLAARAGAWS